jgi:hypothetical protein
MAARMTAGVNRGDARMKTREPRLYLTHSAAPCRLSGFKVNYDIHAYFRVGSSCAGG